jgi:antitoxin ParD1/3/4
MTATKISVSIPESLSQFIDRYKADRGYKSTSQVIGKALSLLQEQELEAAYRAAASEDDPIWEATIGDGLSDETW